MACFDALGGPLCHSGGLQLGAIDGTRRSDRLTQPLAQLGLGWWWRWRSLQRWIEFAMTSAVIASHVRCWLRCLGTSNIVALVAPPKTSCSLASATISRRFFGF